MGAFMQGAAQAVKRGLRPCPNAGFALAEADGFGQYSPLSWPILLSSR
jgi:hypothetical protein